MCIKRSFEIYKIEILKYSDSSNIQIKTLLYSFPKVKLGNWVKVLILREQIGNKMGQPEITNNERKVINT